MLNIKTPCMFQDEPVESQKVPPRQFHYSECPKMRKFWAPPVPPAPSVPPSVAVDMWDTLSDDSQPD